MVKTHVDHSQILWPRGLRDLIGDGMDGVLGIAGRLRPVIPVLWGGLIGPRLACIELTRALGAAFSESRTGAARASWSAAGRLEARAWEIRPPQEDRSFSVASPNEGSI